MHTTSRSRTPTPVASSNARRAIRIGLTAAAGTLTLIALSACTASSPTHSTKAVDESSISGLLPAKNINAWTMPLDQYIPSNTHAADYAENLLVEPCMVKAGYAWNVPWQDITNDHTASLNTAGVSDFNLTLAEQWGYHLAPINDPSNATWQAFSKSEINLPDAKETALSTCITAARKTLPRLPGSAQVGVALGSESYDEATQDTVVKKTAAQWAKCMLPQGVSDLPASPRDMPSPSLAAKYSITEDVSTAVPAVSAGERAVAVADAKCRLSSDYDSTLYNDEWNRQAQLLAKNADELQRIAAEIKANSAAVEKVITDHAPQH